MNSGPKWSLRNGSPYQRLCARPGCGAPASVTLRFQPTERQAWLVQLDEHAARTQGDLCNRHAAALVLPRGWELHDERDLGPRATLAADAPAPKPNGKGVRRVRVGRKGATNLPPEATALPGLEPVTEPAVEPHRVASDDVHRDGTAAHRPVAVPFGVDDEVEEALGAILDARTPLLQRAFRNSRPLDAAASYGPPSREDAPQGPGLRSAPGLESNE